MKLYDWNEKYSVGIESLDQDHKALFSLINKFFDAMRQGKAKEILNETLDDLISYTRTHFKREELLFSSTHYSDFQKHKIEHDHFIEKIDEFREQYDAGNQRISIELIKFLSDWLVNHIQSSDKKYSSYLKKYDAN
jgi:hemerythrin